MSKHIHIHVGRTKDAGEKATPDQIAEIKRLVSDISKAASLSNMLQSDVQEGIKALRSAKHWLT